jgi:hypothetical protein
MNKITILISFLMLYSNIIFSQTKNEHNHEIYGFFGAILTPNTTWVRLTFLNIEVKHKHPPLESNWNTSIILSLYFIDLRRIVPKSETRGRIGGGIGVGALVSKKIKNKTWFFIEPELEVLLGNLNIGSGIFWSTDNERFMSKVGLFQYFNPQNNIEGYRYDIGIQIQFGMMFGGI